MDGNESSLPSAWIARLFSRFQAAYGNRMQTMWKDADPQEVQALWAAELSAFDAVDIRTALAAMGHAYPEYPPTLYEFRNLCRDAARSRSQLTARVEHTRYGGPSPVVLAAIHELTKDPLTRKRDPRDWARKILKREQEGERVTMYALQCAREALGLCGSD